MRSPPLRNCSANIKTTSDPNCWFFSFYQRNQPGLNFQPYLTPELPRRHFGTTLHDGYCQLANSSPSQLPTTRREDLTQLVEKFLTTRQATNTVTFHMAISLTVNHESSLTTTNLQILGAQKKLHTTIDNTMETWEAKAQRRQSITIYSNMFDNADVNKQKIHRKISELVQHAPDPTDSSVFLRLHPMFNNIVHLSITRVHIPVGENYPQK